jgi:hypothetical protein
MREIIQLRLQNLKEKIGSETCDVRQTGCENVYWIKMAEDRIMGEIYTRKDFI